MNSFFTHARLRLLGTLLVALLAIVFTTTSSTAQTGGQWDYVDIGAARNSNSAQTGLNIHDPNDGGSFTNIQLVERAHSGSHAILFNAYKSDNPVTGSIGALGNTKYANNVGNYSSGAGMIAFYGNSGAMRFYVSPASTGKDTNVEWGVPELSIQRTGRVGIGTSDPDRRLTVVGGTGTYVNVRTSDDKEVLLGAGAPGGVLSVMSDHDLQIRAGGNSTKMTIKADGKVGIGTTNPSHKLAVDGTIRAKEIIVDTGWSDFVFDDNYNLLTLAEVADHIDTHGHLPDVPSATDVAAEGVSLGAMDALLLQKIEELTLYTIDQETQLNTLTEQNAELLEQNTRLVQTLEQFQERLTALETER